MQLGMIGLGRMGGNIVRRLMKQGHSTVVYDKDPKAVAALSADGAVGAGTLEDFVDRLERPRTAWVMLPAGKITEATIDTLSKLMHAGDVIIDGGNTFWQDDVRRGKALKERGIHYVDVGTSGGGLGINRGPLLMCGGGTGGGARVAPMFGGPLQKPDTGKLFGICGGFRRRPLDRERRDRRGGPGRSAYRCTVRALSLAQAAHLRRKDSLCDARRLRRPQGAAAAC